METRGALEIAASAGLDQFILERKVIRVGYWLHKVFLGPFQIAVVVGMKFRYPSRRAE